MGHLFGVEGKRLIAKPTHDHIIRFHASFGDYGGANDGAIGIIRDTFAKF